MTKSSLLLAGAGLVAACASYDDLELTGERAPVVACSLPSPGAGGACASESGTLTFQVTLPGGQQYVELFSRQNGEQNLATNIVGSGVANADGTTTYSFSRSGYAASDVVEYRFYSYAPGAPGVFTPGPAEQVWYTFAASPSGSTSVPVSKDAAVIYSSYGAGYVPDVNFGSASSVDIGEYHLTSQGLFGYSLAAVPAGVTVTRAEIVVPSAYAPGGSVVNLRLSLITAPWSESTVTWNTRPAATYLRDVLVTHGQVSRIDVTAEVAAALGGEISFSLAPSSLPTTDNVFIDAREKIDGAPTFLVVEWTK
jgi:hypothetical protein